jgi:hypothetical protein
VSIQPESTLALPCKASNTDCTMSKCERVAMMVQGLQRQDDPSLGSNGTAEKRDYHREYKKGYVSTAVGRACDDGVALEGQDPELEWPQVVKICNNALCFEGGYVHVRGKYGEGGKFSRLSAKFHIALCQEDHKVGKRSVNKNKNDDWCCGEMFGSSTGQKIVRGSDGTSYANLLKMDDSYLHKPEWDEAVGDNRWVVFASNNDENVRSVCLLLRCSN